MNNVVVMISGEGTTLQSLLDNCKVANVVGVISNNACVGGITRSIFSNVPHIKVFVPYPQECSGSYEGRLINGLNDIIKKAGGVKFIVLAGFMKILSADFIEYYNNKGIQIVNIHPSLLPNHKGLNTHKRVLANDDESHGMTIHYVTDKVDSGEIIFQRSFYVTDADTVSTLERKVKQLEQMYYPLVVDDLLVKMDNLIA
jgi:phosphoribosylglycinamide formyltransferase-1